MKPDFLHQARQCSCSGARLYLKTGTTAFQGAFQGHRSCVALAARRPWKAIVHASDTGLRTKPSARPSQAILTSLRLGISITPHFALSLWLLAAFTSAAETRSFDALQTEFEQQIRPILKQFCLDCHSAEAQEGELDLERFATFSAVRDDPSTWQKVAEMLDNGEMPPDDSEQPTARQQTQLRAWIAAYLDAEALANAGDPGPIALRRLNNAQYTYTIRDLTGVQLDPAREFPVDSAAGEGFTNTGASLVMSPALVQKYFDAGKAIASHAVLLPDGFRFSAGTTRRDWEIEILSQISSLYALHTSGGSDVSLLDRWSVPDPTKSTENDGRIDLERYIAALIQQREQLLADLDAAEAIARTNNLNAKYFRLLAAMLVSDEAPSLLLDSLRRRWRQATAEDAAALTAVIRAWQDQLWKFNPVGHLGIVQPWQEPVTPIRESHHIRVKLDAPTEGDTISLYLVAGPAGDGNAADIVAWQNPRIERSGRPAILLRDVRAMGLKLARIREQTLSQTTKYLTAAFAARQPGSERDIAKLAAAHAVDPLILKPLLSYLGIEADGELKIGGYLTQYRQETAGYDFVNAWLIPDVADFSLVSNSSDQAVNIPGTVRPHKVTVHPRPDRWIAAGWRSPIEGRVTLTPRVQDAHPACGNGVSWSLELRRGAQRRMLAEGTVDRAGTAAPEPLRDISIHKGDLISLVIGPRDRQHACDLTEIDLTVTVADDSADPRAWSLSGDCADSLGAGNPHPDSFGNRDIWHFYGGMLDGESAPRAIPPGSLLARWLDASAAEAAVQLAAELEELLTRPLAQDAPPPDAEVYRALTALDGPLFSHIDSAALARTVAEDELAGVEFGLDPQLFGRHPDGSAAPSEHLVVQAPAVIEIKLPASLAAGAEFAVAGRLHDSQSRAGSVQLLVLDSRAKSQMGAEIDNLRGFVAAGKSATASNPSATSNGVLLPGVPIVVRKGSQAEARVRKSFDDFRRLFPAAMCHARIVPVDEVVTLLLFHREDEHLARLMLSDAEQARLDRLWDELHYVSQDALRIENSLEQILEFSTQDADPRKFDPVLKPIAAGAAAFRQRLLVTAPAHVDALVKFAARAYRRPLGANEDAGIRRLYETLCQEEIPHEEAFRLTLAKVLAAPAFLYRLERPGLGREPSAVGNEELASRLSYFLWSSAPDDELRQVAAAGQLVQPDILVAQTHRMLRDARTRRLAIEFACQWLHIRDFDQLDEKSERHFPQFTDLRDDIYEESIRFFADLFRNDGSILNILAADYTFVNESLATLYGIPDVSGSDWRRVEGVREYGRGGILGLATTLAKQSGASRTSPILRGNWISETLLGERLPKPPQDVPQLPDDEADLDGLTMRQVIEKHTADPACAKCHVRIDPYGFALESYDAIGRLRQQDLGGRPIDTNTTLMDGAQIDGINGLREYLVVTRRNDFLRQFCRKLVGYALGRAVQLSDEPLLNEMMTRLAENDYRFGAAVDTIVLSKQFRMIRGSDRQ